MKALLKRFGEVAATTSFYAGTRAAGPAERPGENFTSMEDLKPGEPALMVKISAEGEFRIDKIVDENGVDGAVSLLQVPEDEFWFFEAFRPALSSLSVAAPGFLFEMAVITLYAVFEAFVADLLRDRLRRHPRLITAKASQAASAEGTAADRLQRSIEIDVRRRTYGAIGALLEAARTELDMTTLPREFDQATQTVALVRNCLLHAGGIIDARLASTDNTYLRGERLAIDAAAMAQAMQTLRGIALALDRADQI